VEFKETLVIPGLIRFSVFKFVHLGKPSFLFPVFSANIPKISSCGKPDTLSPGLPLPQFAVVWLVAAGYSLHQTHGLILGGESCHSGLGLLSLRASRPVPWAGTSFETIGARAGYGALGLAPTSGARKQHRSRRAGKRGALKSAAAAAATLSGFMHTFRIFGRANRASPS